MAKRLLTSFKDHQNWTIVQHQSQQGKCDWGGSRICTKPSRPWDMGSVGTRKCTKPWCHLQEYTCRLCKVKNFNLEMYISPLSLFQDYKASHQRNQILYNTYFHKLASRVFLSHQYHRPIIGPGKNGNRLFKLLFPKFHFTEKVRPKKTTRQWQSLSFWGPV